MKIAGFVVTIVILIAIILGLVPQTQALTTFDPEVTPQSHSATMTPSPPPPAPTLNLKENSAATTQPQKLDTPYYYYYFDKPIPLTPKANQFMIGVRKTAGASRLSADSHVASFATLKQLSDVAPDGLELWQADFTGKSLTTQQQLEMLNALSNLQFYSPVFDVPTYKQTAFYSNLITAKFKDNISETKINAALNLLGLCKDRQVNWGKGIWILTICGLQKNVVSLANQLYESQVVEFAQPNFVYTVAAFAENSDPPILAPQFVSASTDPWFLTQISARNAWPLVSAHLAKTPIVAVIDGGVQSSHEDLSANMYSQGYDAVYHNIGGVDTHGEPTICPGGYDAENGHGTEIAGVIAANVNKSSSKDIAVGMTGNLAKIMSVRIRYRDCSTNEVRADDLWRADGIAWATKAPHRADVINLSSGEYGEYFLPDANLLTVIQDARAAGVVVVGASGNHNLGYVMFPAAYSEVIAVGGTDPADTKWTSDICPRLSFCGSNYGTALDIVAPSVEITSTYLNNTYPKGLDGTSYAAPQVAGVAALMKAVNPNLTPFQVQDILQRTADKVGGYDYSQRLDESGWNNKMGFGRLNAYRAVQAVVLDLPRLSFSARLKYAPLDKQTVSTAIAVFGNYRDSDGKHPLRYTNTVPTDSSGHSQYDVTLPGIASGEYTVCAKPQHYLWRCVTKYLGVGVNIFVDFTAGGYLFIPGDFNKGGEDGVVNAPDLESFRKGYFACGYSTVGTCAEYDFDRDGWLMSVDYIIFLLGYNTRSDGWAYIKDSPWRPFNTTTNSPQPVAPQSPESISIHIYNNQGAPFVGWGNYGVNVSLDLSGLSVGAGSANLIIHYDPGVWDVADSDPNKAGIQVSMWNDVFPVSDGGLVDPVKGEINMGAWTSSSTSGSTSRGLLATIAFIPIRGITRTSIWAEWRPNETSLSNLSEFNTAISLLGDIVPFETGVDGPPQRPMPAVSISVPQGDVIGTYSVPISVAAQDSFNQVQWVEVEAYYDNAWHIVGDDTNPADGWNVNWDTTGISDQDIALYAYAVLPGGTYGEVYSNWIALDRTPPSYLYHWFWPEPPAWPDAVQVHLSAYDNLSHVKRIEMYVNDAADGSDTGNWILADYLDGVEGGDLYWYTAGFTIGAHRIAFAIQDNAGNWSRWSASNLPTIVYGAPQVYLPLVRNQ